MIIKNCTKDTTIASECRLANNFFTRFKGLMGVSSLPDGNGLWILPCNSIHMFFMKIPLDVVFLDKDNNVVHLIEGIKPWKVSKIVFKAHSVLELPVGTIAQSLTAEGDMLQIVNIAE